MQCTVPDFVYNSGNDSFPPQFVDYVQLSCPDLLQPSTCYLTPSYKSKSTNFRTKNVLVYDVRDVWRTPFTKAAYGSKVIHSFDRTSYLTEEFVRKIVADVCSKRKTENRNSVNNWTGSPNPSSVLSERRRLNSKYVVDKKRKNVFPILNSQCRKNSKVEAQKVNLTQLSKPVISYNLENEREFPFDFFNFQTDYMVSPMSSTPPSPHNNCVNDNMINMPLYMPKLCTDPDQMFNQEARHSSEGNCFDSDMDLQEQILIEEDRDRSMTWLQDQNSMDKYSARMQYKLITDITGKNEQSALLGIVNSGQQSPSMNTEVSVSTHKTLIICTQNNKSFSCSHYKCQPKVKKKMVRFNLDNVKASKRLSEKTTKSTADKNTPDHLKKLVMSFSQFGVGKKALIRKCSSLKPNGWKRGLYTLTRLHLPSKVKNVAITPGSHDLTIEGVPFSLPCDSTILAVTNETTDTFHDALNDDVGSFDAMLLNSDRDIDHEMFNVSFNLHDLSGISNISSVSALEEIVTGISDENGALPSAMNESFCLKDVDSESEGEMVNDFEGFEDTRTSSQKQDVEDFIEPNTVVEPVKVHYSYPIIEEFEVSKTFPEEENVLLDYFSLNQNMALEEDLSIGGKTSSPVKNVVDRVSPSPEKKKPEDTRKKPVLSLIERHNQMKIRKWKAHQQIRDAIPIEIIEKIKASGKRSCTKILAEALIPKLKRKKGAKKQKRLKKTSSSKKKKNLNKNISSPKKSKIDIATPPIDHEYCKSPMKKQIKTEKEELQEVSTPIFNKIPEYCQAIIKKIKQEPPEVITQDCFKKDSGVDSGNVSDSSLFENEDRKNKALSLVPQLVIKKELDVITIEDENTYSRLPDYVTDIGNVTPKESLVTVKEELDSSEDCIETVKELDDSIVIVKEEVNLHEDSSEPLGEKPRKKKLNLSEYRMRKKHSADNSRCNSPYLGDDKYGYQMVDEKEEGEVKEDVAAVAANDIPTTTTVVAVKQEPNPEPVSKSLDKIDKSGVEKNMKRHHEKSQKSKSNIIIIDVEKEEEEKERKQKIKAKLNVISHMPSTSLGHCLLNSSHKNESQKSGSSSSRRGSTKHRYSSSRSRSRSRSHSSKGGSRYRKSRRSKHSHRKSRRRSSRSRSRGRSSTSTVRSYSNSSRSRSRSHSNKSYRSRSRSRSKSRSSRRKNRKHRRHSRSRDRSRRRSVSISSINWGSKSHFESPNYDQFYGYSSGSTGYYSYVPSEYPTCHRNSKEISRDEERKIIYVGGIEQGITNDDLRHRFERFGQIIDISVHFRERGDNYGFITFRHKENAYDAMEHGNDDPSLPWYNICFGGRRNFCREEYADLDAQNDDDFYNSASAMDYDTLLRTTLQLKR